MAVGKVDIDKLDKASMLSWKNTPLEGKHDLLQKECSKSSIPETCVLIISIQVKYETNFGRAGVGFKYKNLTGIRDNGKWRKYESYDDSIKDTVSLFIKGNYQDYFTIYSFEEGLKKYLKRWGTNQYDKFIKEINLLI